MDLHKLIGRFVVDGVRDRAIRHVDDLCKIGFASERSKRLHGLLTEHGVLAGSDLTATIVDVVIMELLDVLDSGVVDVDGQGVGVECIGMQVGEDLVRLDTDGMWCGLYQGPDGWMATMSQERKSLFATWPNDPG